MEERSLKHLKVTQAWPESEISVTEDLISKLPDSLICQILMYLQTKHAVRTSVLSNRWKSLWLFSPQLELDANEFRNYNAFVSFIDRFIDLSREHKLCLHKFKVSVRKNVDDPPCVTRWIDFVAKRKLQHLDVRCRVHFLDEMPLSLYTCNTLVYLRLRRVSFGKFESVSLPCLKTMRLEQNIYASDVVLELLISSCPVLEDLIIIRMVQDNVKVLRVHSQTLSSLRIYFRHGDELFEGFDRKFSAVLIDAPRLEYLKFHDDRSESKIITNSGSLAKVDVVSVFNDNDMAHVVDLPKRNMVRNFFTSISGVREMKMYSRVSRFLYHNMNLDPLPQFCNLSHLKVHFYVYFLDSVPTLLESCPNLKSLVLELEFEDIEEINLSSVPRCLVSSLQFVEIKYFSGEPFKMKLAKYFVENSGVLKKLALHLWDPTLEGRFCLLNDLLALPRGSSTCQIVFC